MQFHYYSFIDVSRLPYFFLSLLTNALYIGPGYFLEVRKILPLLNEVSADHPSFHRVTFNLPEFGFSGALAKKGFLSNHYAEVQALNNTRLRCQKITCLQIEHKLMLALRYNEYGTISDFVVINPTD